MPRAAAGRSRPVKVAEKSDTRERILDVALDLFAEQGFDKTSLREIAEKLDVTKAALYYHFASKDDILMALHVRFHDMMLETTENLFATDGDPRLVYARALDRLIDEIILNAKLFQLHQRNMAAFEKLHANQGYEDRHNDLENQVRATLANAALPTRIRVRLACALGAVVFGLLIPGDAFADIDRLELAELLREVVTELLDGVG